VAELDPNPPRKALGPWFRAIGLVLIVATGFVLFRWTSVGEYLTEDKLVGLLTSVREIWWAPIALIGLYAVLAPLGVSMVPLMVAGAVFGPLAGSITNTTGLVLGAIVSFWLARGLGRSFVLQMTGQRVRRAERLADRHGFWPLVQTRFLPLPFPVVNFGAALAGVSPSRFLAASVIGLVPSTVVHTFFISNIMFLQGYDRALYLGGYALAFVIFNLLIGIPWLRRQWRRRDRYRRLVASREARGRPAGQ